MTALVGGLRGGIKAYEGVKRHHKEEGHLRRAFRILDEDLRQVYVISEEEPALVEEVRNDGRESLSITNLRPVRQLRTELPFDLQRTAYFVDKTPDGEQSALWRTTTPLAGDTQVSASGSQNSSTEREILVRGVKGVRFDYASPDGLVGEWDNKELLPGTVVVTLELDSGKTVSVSAWVPLGTLGN